MTRKQQVQTLRASGLILDKIAAQLGVCPTTVSNYLNPEKTTAERNARKLKGPHVRIFLNEGESLEDRERQMAFRTEQRYRSFSQRIRGVDDGRYVSLPALDPEDPSNQ